MYSLLVVDLGIILFIHNNCNPLRLLIYQFKCSAKALSPFHLKYSLYIWNDIRWSYKICFHSKHLGNFFDYSQNFYFQQSKIRNDPNVLQLVVMVHFMCQLGWTTMPSYWPNIKTAVKIFHRQNSHLQSVDFKITLNNEIQASSSQLNTLRIL